MKRVFIAACALVLLSAPAFAQYSPGSSNELPSTLQIDVGLFRVAPSTELRLDAGDRVDVEQDLGFGTKADTWWIDTTWRPHRRHQFKLDYTRLHRSIADYELQDGFTWAGQVYGAGFTATSDINTDFWSGYYRFAVVKNTRFEIGPALGIGYIKVTARIAATGVIVGPGGAVSRSFDESASMGAPTGAVGGYMSAWLAKRFVTNADFLYIKITPGEDQATVTDWRVGANYYFARHAGVGVQYKLNRYGYDRGILSQTLGGDITYRGGQVYLSFLF